MEVIMTEPRIAETAAYKQHGTIIINSAGGVWFTFSKPWWSILWWLWWWLTPGVKGMVLLQLEDKRSAYVRAVRLAETHVKLGGGA